MRSPTNAILTGLAVADLAVMVDYMPYACHHYIWKQLNYKREELLTYGWAVYTHFHSLFSQGCHTVSIFLTVTLAIWRYIAVAFPQKNRVWCRIETTITTIILSYIISPIIISPLYFNYSIVAKNETVNAMGQRIPDNANKSNVETYEITTYVMDWSKFTREHPAFNVFCLWTYSVIIKLIPCIALTILSIRLIAALLEAKKRRKMLTSHANGMKQIVNGKAVERPRKTNKTLEKEKQTDRTTRMLLAVLLLFLITEVPQGIMGLLSASLHDTFFKNCYSKLGELVIFLKYIHIIFILTFDHLCICGGDSIREGLPAVF